MEYQVITVKAKRGLKTDFERSAEELSRKVNEAIGAGWEPIGGVAVGRTWSAETPYLFQAIVKR